MDTILDTARTALLVIDPQKDLLDPSGKAWDLFGEQVTKRRTVERLRRLRDGAEAVGMPIFYSRIGVPSYEGWDARSGIRALMEQRGLFLEGEGDRIIDELAPTPNTVLLSPRTGPSPVNSDMDDRLRNAGVDTIVVAGMVANLCVETHVRVATDDGFRTVVVGDAVATLSDEAHDATLANFALVATEVVSTDDVLDMLGAGAPA